MRESKALRAADGAHTLSAEDKEEMSPLMDSCFGHVRLASVQEVHIDLMSRSCENIGNLQ